MSNPNPSVSKPPTSQAGSDSTAVDPNRASVTVWIAVIAAMIGSFMEVLNIQITNASLLNIEGGIGTGVDNGSWISTSYLIGEIVVIPLTDFLSRVFSFRRYMLASAALFAVFSVACAFTHDLPSMIAVTLGREEVRNRIAQMTTYFMGHGVPDPAAAHQQAIIALGN